MEIAYWLARLHIEMGKNMLGFSVVSSRGFVSQQIQVKNKDLLFIALTSA